MFDNPDYSLARHKDDLLTPFDRLSRKMYCFIDPNQIQEGQQQAQTRKATDQATRLERNGIVPGATAPASTNRITQTSDDPSVAKLSIECLHLKSWTIVMDPTDVQVDQTFQATYTPEEVYGRMDPIVVYKNTKRRLSIQFRLIASSADGGVTKVSNNAKAIGALSSAVYPTYSGNAVEATSVLESPPFFRLKLWNWVGNFTGTDNMGVTGYIENLNINLGKMEDNVAIGEGDVKLPMWWDVRFEFMVIHENSPGWYNVLNEGQNGTGKMFGGEGNTFNPYPGTTVSDSNINTAANEQREDQSARAEVELAEAGSVLRA